MLVQSYSKMKLKLVFKIAQKQYEILRLLKKSYYFVSFYNKSWLNKDFCLSCQDLKMCKIDLKKLSPLQPICLKESFLSLKIKYSCQSNRIKCIIF